MRYNYKYSRNDRNDNKPLLEGIFDNYDVQLHKFRNRNNSREPKIWTVEKLYKLWMKSLDRNYLRRKEVNKCIDEINENIIPEIICNEEVRVVYSNYHNIGGDESIHRTVIGKSSSGGWCTWSDGEIGDKDNIKDERDESIDILLHQEEKLMYGNRYKRLSHLSINYFSRWILTHIWAIIESKLKEKYKSIDAPKIIPITICGDKFYVSSNVDQYPYIKFKFMGAATDDVIEF